MSIPAIHCHDAYKADHRRQYAPGTTKIYSNFTPRASRVDGSNEVVFFGLQYFCLWFLIEQFNSTFFYLPEEEAVGRYKRRMDAYLGKDAISMEHMRALHRRGRLPVRIRALPEGSLVPVQVPCLTITNTRPEFFWLVNFLETIMSATLWGPTTTATTARLYRKMFNEYAEKTGADQGFCQWQGHDFSMRGMWGLNAAALSGAGWLTSFTGTDTVPAIDLLEQYYGADCEKELVGGSVAASEHSTATAGGRDGEFDMFKRMITEVYPSGIVSLVSDSYDFWAVVTDMLPRLKALIMARDGKVVIRPDSGDPVKIVIGDENAAAGTPERKGLIECLWDIFGGTLTDKGFRLLDSHIGAIYGDSITLDRQFRILDGLTKKGFASSNIVMGVGSYSLTYVTRDTYGFAMKATYAEVDGVGRDLFKQPKTDSGKNSHRGLIRVDQVDGKYVAKYPVSPEEEAGGELQTVFDDGELVRRTTLAEVRARVAASLAR